MKRWNFLAVGIVLFLCFSGYVNAQNKTDQPKPKKDYWNRVFTGGNLGLQFGTITFVDLSPLIGYKVTDKLDVGAGIIYQYYKYNDPVYGFSTNVYGGRVFSRYYITDNLFAHAEYDQINLESFDFHTRVNVSSVLLGGGYRQLIGPRAAFTVVVLWDVNQSVYSPYSNPIIRAGFNIGL